LSRLDLDMSAAASQLSDIGVAQPEAVAVLKELHSKYPLALMFVTADASGKIVAAYPEGYSSFEGTYISPKNLRKPEFKWVFIMVEVTNTFAFTWPVFSPNGGATGSVSLIFEPEKLLASTSVLIPKGSDVSIEILQTDGLYIYDSTGAVTGYNLFTSPGFKQYKGLLAFGRKVVSKKSGSGSLTIIDSTTGQTVKKEVAWSTVKLYDITWRVMCSQVVP